MNAGPTVIWLQLLGLLAVEMALVVGAAALISRFVLSAVWRRVVWQVCLLSLLVLTLSEVTGTARSVMSWLAVKVRLENHAVAKPSAENRSSERPGHLGEALRVAPPGAEEIHIQGNETAGAALLVAQLSGTNIQPVPALIDRHPKQNGAGVDDDSVPDSLAILCFELIWLIGVALVIARCCLAQALYALFRRHRQAVSDLKLLGRVEALARLLGIKRRVQLVESSWLAGPIVFGVFRPVIGLPTGFAGRFSPVQQEAMLAHELAHVASADSLWYLLANWASAILWWHPSVWWARRQLHSASEQAADEASLVVADGPRVLAECLVEMGARLKQQPSFGWMGVEGNGLRSGLGRRVERLVHLRGDLLPSPGCLRSALAKIVGPAALVPAVLLSTAWAGPQAFTQGESMKTMEQVWRSSLAAFALLASPQEETHAALAVNAKREDNPIDSARLLQDGRLLYEMGKLDEAESKLKQVVSGSPGNEKAFYYLTLIQERRYAQNANDRKETPTPSGLPDGNPRASEPANSPNAEQTKYYRLMMERYGINPREAALPFDKPPETKERSALASKLGGIVLKEVMFDGVPLAEVLRFLDEETRKRDPDKKGINFLINPNTVQSVPASVIDPQTGQMITLPPPEPMEMNSVIVRFNLPLREVRLKDVLDAIVKVADKPIEYSIEEYGVLFSQAANPLADPTVASAGKSPEAAQLQVRTFKVDADKLLPGMKRAFGINLEGLPSDHSNNRSASPDVSVENLRAELESLEKQLTNLLTQFTGQSPYVVKVRSEIRAVKESLKAKLSGEPGQIQVALRRLLTQLGVNMDLPGKALFYNDLTGILMVRATTEDLTIVQGAVETLGGVANEQGPQAGSRGEGALSSPEDRLRQRYGPGSAKK